MKEKAQIQSRKNEIIKDYIRLTQSSSYRRQRAMFTAEGARLCSDAAKSAADIISVFYTEKAKEKYGKYLSEILSVCGKSYEISAFVAEAMSDVKSSQGIFCVIRQKEPLSVNLLSKNKKYIAGETIQDPSNLGALFRTAEALGMDGVILSGDCCDVYSPKAMRASMGAIFRMPVFVFENFEEEIKKLTDSGFETFAAVVDKDAKSITSCDFSNGAVAVIGNEGNGLTKGTVDSCKYAVTVKMKGRAQSLNASAAATIIMWEMARF